VGRVTARGTACTLLGLVALALPVPTAAAELATSAPPPATSATSTPPPAAAQMERAAPDSPAGVEYALPLDRAREDAASRPRRGSGAAPLFGAGVGPPGGAGGEAGGSGGAPGGDGREVAGRRADGPDAGGARRPPTDAGGSGASVTGDRRQTGGSAPLVPAAIALLALGLGVVAGLLLRRRPGWRGGVDAGLALALAAGCGLTPLWRGLYGFASWGSVALALIALLAALLVAGRPRPGPLGLVALGGAGLLWVWATLSTRWAESAGQALLAADRWLLYAVLLAVLLAIVRDDRGARLLVAAGAVATAAFAGYLCARLALPGSADLFLGGRLDDPLGYVNGQAGHLLLALWPALAVAEAARSPRLAGAALAVAVVLAGLLALSQSRAVALAGLAVAVLLLVLVPGRRQRAWCLVTLGLGVALAAGPLLDVYGATTPGDRRPDEDALRGAVLGLLAAAALAGAAWGCVRWLAARPAQPAALARLRALSGVALAVVGLGLAAGVAGAVGDPVERARGGVEEFKALDVEATRDGGSRFASGGGNRYDYWRVAAGQLADRPLTGIGAGNYDVTYFAERRTDEDVRQPHSLALQALAELGVVGLLGVLALVGAPLAGLLRRSRRARRDRGERLLAVAAGGTFAAWLVHTSVDWLHLIPGVTGIALCAAVALVVARRAGEGEPATRPALGRPAVAGALAALAAGAFLIAAPLLAERDTARAQDLVASDPRAALAASERALRRDDESLPAYYAAAAAHARLGDYRAARAALLAATAREPRDFVAWGLLGDLAVRRGALHQARAAYVRAARLNPRDRGLRALARDPAAAQARVTTAN
jgi:hypothetical protein